MNYPLRLADVEPLENRAQKVRDAFKKRPKPRLYVVQPNDLHVWVNEERAIAERDLKINLGRKFNRGSKGYKLRSALNNLYTYGDQDINDRPLELVHAMVSWVQAIHDYKVQK